MATDRRSRAAARNLKRTPQVPLVQSPPHISSETVGGRGSPPFAPHAMPKPVPGVPDALQPDAGATPAPPAGGPKFVPSAVLALRNLRNRGKGA